MKKSLELLIASSLILPSCGEYKFYKRDTIKIPYKEWTEVKNLGYKSDKASEISYDTKIENSELKIKASIKEYEVKNQVQEESYIREFEVNEIEIEKYRSDSNCYWGAPLFGIFGILGIIALALSENSKEAGAFALSEILFVGSTIGCIVDLSKSGKTREKNVSSNYVRETTREGKKSIPAEKRLLNASPLTNANLEVYSEMLRLAGPFVTDSKGIATIKINPSKEIILDYNDFINREEVRMFQGLCDLKNAYELLPKKDAEIEIIYKGKKNKSSANVKTGIKKEIKSALKTAGCF